MSDARERVVAVTGGSRGIGAAVTRRLVADGYAVAIGYRSNVDAAAAFVEELRSTGGSVRAFEVDITDAASLDTFIAGAERMGALVGVVANAGSVAWLLSNDATYATGTVLRVAGGL